MFQGGANRGDIVVLESRNLSKVISSSSDVIYGIAQEDVSEGEVFKVLIPEEYLDKTIYEISLDLQGGDIKTEFSYTGKVQSVPLSPGAYKLEVWGAQGGYRSSSSYGGKGGYSVGTLNLTSRQTVYVYVGGAGNTGKTSGGFNGGGSRTTYNGGRRCF